MTFRVWIQTADFETAIEEPVIDPARVLDLFDGYDWIGAVRVQARLTADGEESCPPGLGLVDEETGDILHLCPDGRDYVLAHFHTTERTRRLGLFQNEKPVARVVENLPFDVARLAIPRFLQRDVAWLERAFQPPPRPI